MALTKKVAQARVSRPQNPSTYNHVLDLADETKDAVSYQPIYINAVRAYRVVTIGEVVKRALLVNNSDLRSRRKSAEIPGLLLLPRPYSSLLGPDLDGFDVIGGLAQLGELLVEDQEAFDGGLSVEFGCWFVCVVRPISPNSVRCRPTRSGDLGIDKQISGCFDQA